MGMSSSNLHRSVEDKEVGGCRFSSPLHFFWINSITDLNFLSVMSFLTSKSIAKGEIDLIMILKSGDTKFRLILDPSAQCTRIPVIFKNCSMVTIPVSNTSLNRWICSSLCFVSNVIILFTKSSFFHYHYWH